MKDAGHAYDKARRAPIVEDQVATAVSLDSYSAEAKEVDVGGGGGVGSGQHPGLGLHKGGVLEDGGDGTGHVAVGQVVEHQEVTVAAHTTGGLTGHIGMSLGGGLQYECKPALSMCSCRTWRPARRRWTQEVHAG